MKVWEWLEKYGNNVDFEPTHKYYRSAIVNEKFEDIGNDFYIRNNNSWNTKVLNRFVIKVVTDSRCEKYVSYDYPHSKVNFMLVTSEKGWDYCEFHNTFHSHDYNLNLCPEFGGKEKNENSK